MTTLLDYRSSEPSNVQGKGVLPGGVNLPAPVSTAVTGTELADLGIYLSKGSPNRVELTASIGFKATTGLSKIALIVLRDNYQIYASEQGAESGFEQFYTATLEAVDFNVPMGFHVYQVVAVNLAAGTEVLVAGPVVFSGAAYAL